MSDRTVIVTGGTGGIGLALAEGFVLAGSRVVVASRKAEACEEAAAHLRDLGGQAIGVPAHLGEVEDLGALVQNTVDEFGGVDVVVNNAANPLAQPLGAMIFSPMLSIYSSMKAAMMSFTRSMAAEFAHHGIRVNAIAPGPVDTNMMQQNPQEAADAMVGGTLMKRLATPDEMVESALLLCSDAGSYMTGSVVIVDGGGTPR